MPCEFLNPEPLAKHIEEERPTVSAAVPTIWSELLRYAEDNDVDFSSINRIICGGSAVPPAVRRGGEEKHGLTITRGGGMTETSPLGSRARPPAGTTGDEHWEYRSR